MFLLLLYLGFFKMKRDWKAHVKLEFTYCIGRILDYCILFFFQHGLSTFTKYFVKPSFSVSGCGLHHSGALPANRGQGINVFDYITRKAFCKAPFNLKHENHFVAKHDFLILYYSLEALFKIGL